MSRRHGPLNVHEHGDPATPVLLVLHGITDSGECFADLVERLGSTYRIIAPDALAHGGSDRLTQEQLALEEPTEVMYGALEDLLRDVGPALVMGHSMGGGLAAALIARRPELVLAGVLEDPVWFDPRGGPDTDRLREERIAFARTMAADEESALAWCRSENPTWPESEYRPWARAKAAVDPEFLQSGAGVLHTPWREIAGAIRTPTLVITGDREVILNERTLAEIAALANPALEVHVVPGAGHGIRREHPDAFHALVDPWFEAYAGPAPSNAQRLQAR